MKILRCLGLFACLLICALVIILSEIKKWPGVGSITGVIMGVLIPVWLHAIQDLGDTTNWKASQRRLLRGGYISDDTIIRVSFAYLFRIKAGNKYLLVKNARGTGKYQPVGGVYKMLRNERTNLKNLFRVVDDDKVPLDESSRDDYRLQMQSKYLRRFVARFNSKKANRERIDDVSREFYEELGSILNWNKIRYRYCGRHMTELTFSDHFQCYELLLADIVELNPSQEQRADLERLKNSQSDYYIFATADVINGLGVAPGTDKLEECIADHTKKILQESEVFLTKEPQTGAFFEVSL